MKITKRQLRRIIKEEKASLIKESKAPMPMKSRVDPVFARLIQEQSRAKSEGELQGDLAVIIDAIESIAFEMYGLEDPGSPGAATGDKMAKGLEMQVERLGTFFDQLEAYFTTIDDMAGRNPGGSIG
jgi:hypothetical protein